MLANRDKQLKAERGWLEEKADQEHMMGKPHVGE
jgi:hypothetical protein